LTKISIHQPEHLPWLGFFNKIKNCDIFVILDSVQFRKNYFQNRNRLVDNKNKIYWSTVPIKSFNTLNKNINEVEIENSRLWRKKNLQRIIQSYSKHKYFKHYIYDFEKIYLKEEKFLINFNMKIINFFLKILEINTKIILSSELDILEKKSDLILRICQKLNATSYLSGISGSDYLDLKKFSLKNIDVVFQNFIHPIYPSPNFIPNLSTLDLIFNNGPNSLEFI